MEKQWPNWPSGWFWSVNWLKTMDYPMLLSLKLTLQSTTVPDEIRQLIDQTFQLMLRLKINELLMDVDD